MTKPSHITTEAEFFERGRQLARAADRGETIPDQCHVGVLTSPKEVTLPHSKAAPEAPTTKRKQ